jgi:hypothetical protein
MSKIHYPVKNTLGGEFCKKCLEWSNMVGGLQGFECKATKEEIKQNKKLLATLAQSPRDN